MKNPTYKRLFAYIIDVIIVSVIASIFIDIPILNPYVEKYLETSETILGIYSGATSLGDLDLTRLQYEFVYYSFYSSLIILVVKILYFIVFQYFNKGQTIGKAILKIRLVSEKGKLKFYQVLVTSLIVCNILTSTITLTVLRLTSMDTYLSVSGIINYIELVVFVAIAIMVTWRKDGRGLHDLLSKTKVVYVEKEK